jgi:phosphodiesterase/alkaline phosphatase D-like protein
MRVNMNKVPLALAITFLSGGLLLSNPASASAQILPPAEKAARVQITEGPALESAMDNWAIIRWTSNNPGGTDDHWAVAHYGTDPKNLSVTAKSHIRLNQEHSYTVFRVRVVGLKPKTTYYYAVDSMESNGKSDGVKSPVRQFTTAAPGQRIVAYTPQPFSQ